MEVVLSLFTAFVTSLLSIKIAKPIAERVDLVDRPNERKLHDGSIPLVGGIAVFMGVLFSTLMWLPHSTELNLYVIASALMVFIGALDDRHDLSVRVRLVGQVLVASLMIFGANSYIDSLGNLFGLGEIYLGKSGILLTYIAVLGAINAFNMVDGIDGLVGSMSIVTFTSLAILFLLSDQPELSHFPLIIVVAIFPYLMFNLGIPGGRFKKIFMGDAGSMFIGLSVIWLLALGTQSESRTFSPVTALWIIAVPLMDMAAIMYRRKSKGESMFKPDRDHLHHIFMRAGFSAREALVIITVIAMVFATVGIAGEYLNIPEWLMFCGFIATFLSYCYTLKHVWRLVKLVRVYITHKETLPE